MDVSKLDLRIRHLFVDRSPHEQFLALAMCYILGHMPEAEDGTSAMDSVIGQIVGGSADFSEIIDGKPLLDYHGKNAAQLRASGVAESTIRKVRAALVARNFNMDAFDGPKPAVVGKAAPAQPKTQPAANKADQGQKQDPQTQNPAATNPQDQEPTFAGHKLSELAGKDDKALLAIEGISKATIEKIRAAEAALKK